MPSSCPICEQPIPSTAAHCAVCGFPTGLAIEGLRSLNSFGDGEANGEAVAESAPTPVRSKHAPPPPSAEEELTSAVSRDLRSRMETVRQLGSGPDVTSELCEAALSEAEGRVAEALGILRSAQGRLEGETEQVVRLRLARLKDRRAVLERTGVRLALGREFDRLEAAVNDGERDEAVRILVDTERRVSQFESSWKGLQGLVAQIEALRNEAAALSVPLGEISSELENVRDRIRDGALTEESLDKFAEEAAQILMLLHEAIPAALDEELLRSEKALDLVPEDLPAGSEARRIHLEASRHLKRGRLTEAMDSVRELRKAITALERRPPPPAPGAPSLPLGEDEDTTLERLLKKARSLAARVRTLPVESDMARDAAIQIRAATELLRERNLKEADLTLTRLMQMLATEAPRA